MAAPQNRGNSRAWAPKGPKTGGRSPQTGAKTPERRKRPIFAPWPPKRGNTRPRDTQTRSEPDKRLPWHPARSACLQNRLGHKKTPPEGIRTAPLTSSNCPRGKTVCLDKAARRVGAGREDGKRKKAPRRKSGGAGDEGAGEGCQSSSSSTSITLVWVPLTNSAKASFQPSGLIQA